MEKMASAKRACLVDVQQGPPKRARLEPTEEDAISEWLAKSMIIVSFLTPRELGRFSQCKRLLWRLLSEDIMKLRGRFFLGVLGRSWRLFQRMSHSEENNRNAFRFSMLRTGSRCYVKVRVWFKPHDQPWRVEFWHVRMMDPPAETTIPTEMGLFYGLWNVQTHPIHMDTVVLEQRMKALFRSGYELHVNSA
jgi:hypothetical protein